MKKYIGGFIFARGGSKGVPGKNIRLLGGKPLIAYSIETALQSQFINRIIVSTDDEEIMAIGREYGAKIIVSPPELCTKEALGEDAYVHGYEVIRERLKAEGSRQEGKEVELMVLLFCNAATITAETIDAGIEVLRNNPDYDSAVTVSCYNMWSPLRARKIGEDGLLHPFVPFETFGDPRTLNCDRDSQGDVWFADMDVSIVRPGNLENLNNGLLPQKWMGRKIFPLKQWGASDIDYEWQIPGLIYRLQALGFTKTSTPYDGLSI